MPFEDEAKTSFAQDSGSESNHHFVVSISNSNTPLGQCLEEALISVSRQNCGWKRIGTDGEKQGPSAHYVDADAIQSILEAFGRSMVRTQMQESQKLTIGSSNENAICSNERSRKGAPRALLYGRLDHYNRVGQNWRLVVDNIRVTKRLPLHERAAKRRRHSFWHSNSTPCEQQERQQGQKSAGELVFPDSHEIQILGYNDL